MSSKEYMIHIGQHWFTPDGSTTTHCGPGVKGHTEPETFAFNLFKLDNHGAESYWNKQSDPAYIFEIIKDFTVTKNEYGLDEAVHLVKFKHRPEYDEYLATLRENMRYCRPLMDWLENKNFDKYNWLYDPAKYDYREWHRISGEKTKVISCLNKAAKKGCIKDIYAFIYAEDGSDIKKISGIKPKDAVSTGNYTLLFNRDDVMSTTMSGTGVYVYRFEKDDKWAEICEKYHLQDK